MEIEFSVLESSSREGMCVLAELDSRLRQLLVALRHSLVRLLVGPRVGSVAPQFGIEELYDRDSPAVVIKITKDSGKAEKLPVTYSMTA